MINPDSWFKGLQKDSKWWWILPHGLYQQTHEQVIWATNKDLVLYASDLKYYATLPSYIEFLRSYCKYPLMNQPWCHGMLFIFFRTYYTSWNEQQTLVNIGKGNQKEINNIFQQTWFEWILWGMECHQAFKHGFNSWLVSHNVQDVQGPGSWEIVGFGISEIPLRQYIPGK